MTTHIEEMAIALFGSVARGDEDAFSDRDLLVVAHSPSTLYANKAVYETAGWSCTAYSWDRLHTAAEQGSLFVQHLKQEAIVLMESSHKLSHLLARFSAKGSYDSEFSGALSLLGSLVQYLPNCKAGPMWTLDTLSVGFRSLAVTKLANDGIYAFSNEAIINGMVHKGMINRSEGAKLMYLRKFKSLYRRGLISKNASWPETFEYIRLIDKAFALGLSSSRVRMTDTLDLALASDNARQCPISWYAKCRLIEAALLMLTPRRYNDKEEFRSRRSRLLNLVRSPNTYAWHFTRGQHKTLDQLALLVNISAA